MRIMTSFILWATTLASLCASTAGAIAQDHPAAESDTGYLSSLDDMVGGMDLGSIATQTYDTSTTIAPRLIKKNTTSAFARMDCAMLDKWRAKNITPDGTLKDGGPMSPDLQDALAACAVQAAKSEPSASGS